MIITNHPQTPVVIHGETIEVDSELARLIVAVNRIPGLRTIVSCQECAVIPGSEVGYGFVRITGDAYAVNTIAAKLAGVMPVFDWGAQTQGISRKERREKARLASRTLVKLEAGVQEGIPVFLERMQDETEYTLFLRWIPYKLSWVETLFN